MELRLLHAVAHRQTWYGRWGFLFGRGGFAIGKQASACPSLRHGTSCEMIRISSRLRVAMWIINDAETQSYDAA